MAGTFRIATVFPGRYEDRIHCRIREVSLRDPSEFVALSYCWNSRFNAEEAIRCNGRPLTITANLDAALRNARGTSNPVDLWIVERG